MSPDIQSSFRALADPTRRQILIELGRNDLTITEVVEKFDLSRTAVRKHLTILEEGRLVTVTPKGKERITQLNLVGLRSTAEWFTFFDQYWNTALSSLKHAVDNEKPKN